MNQSTCLLGLCVGALAFADAAPAGAAPGDRPWLDPARAADERAALLVAAMTQAEKLGLLEGDTALDENGTGTNACIGHVGGITRLGLPPLCMGDGPAGVGNGLAGVTQFPAPIALASSWDTELASAFGSALGAEHATKGRNVVLAPTINIARTPLWGRIAETLSEDPVLTAGIGVAIVSGIQSNGVIATPKHFVANNQEWLRLGDAPRYVAINAVVPERALREIYLPAFRAVIEEGRAGSLMCAYNRVNGAYACENALLAVPRAEWGFDGFVVSDWLFAHRSTVASVKAGLDISMPGGASPFGFDDFYAAPLRAALAAETVTLADIDRMVTNVVTPMIRLGLLDRPATGSAGADARSPAHVAIARRIVEEGTVLLRNVGNVLPLTSSVRSIAVIGDDAGANVQTTERYGGFVKSEGIAIATPLEAIVARAGETVSIRYARGTLGTGALPAMPQSAFEPIAGRAGLRASYFANADLAGKPVLLLDRPMVDDVDARPAGLPDLWSARFEGSFTPPRSGRYRFSLSGGGDIALFIGGKRIVYTPKQNFRSITQGTIDLIAGRAIDLRLEYSRASTISPAELRLGWEIPDPTLIQDAAAAARTADVAIVFASDMVSEGADRTELRLPGDQDAMIEAVAAANSRTIVVLHTAGPVLMPWKDRVAGIVAGWYAGEQAAPALTALLFGDVSPSGRLPVTFPSAESEAPLAAPAAYPGIGTTVRYDEGLEVGYRWYQSRGTRPLYPFGFGLSYTRFAFSAPVATPLSGGRWRIAATVRNSGARAGTAVPQLYLTYPAAAGEPPRQLRAFRRLTLAPGATERVSFLLSAADFAIWDDSQHGRRATFGSFSASIGASSEDQPSPVTFTVAAPPINTSKKEKEPA